MDPNSISDRDVAKAKEMLRKSTQDSKSANSISDKDVKMLEKSFLKDESKSLKGRKRYANGGKVNFKGSF